MNRVWFQAGKPIARRRRSREQGQSAVELAIVVPILILLLLAVADFGRVFFVSVAVNNAARAGAQYGSQTVATASDSAGMVAAASADAANVSNFNTPIASACTCQAPFGSVTACPTTGLNDYCKDSPQATYVTVNTSATFNTILPYPGIPSSMVLTGKAIMQVEEN
jgi:Flp pilus assembly protein TadG